VPVSHADVEYPDDPDPGVRGQMDSMMRFLTKYKKAKYGDLFHYVPLNFGMLKEWMNAKPDSTKFVVAIVAIDTGNLMVQLPFAQVAVSTRTKPGSREKNLSSHWIGAVKIQGTITFRYFQTDVPPVLKARMTRMNAGTGALLGGVSVTKDPMRAFRQQTRASGRALAFSFRLRS
jgi:hypothetical protein